MPSPRSCVSVRPRRSAPPSIIAVVKANAYGHGSSQVALALQRAGATMLACADIEEGIVLRTAGVTLPILVFGALGISDLDGVFEHDLTPTISTPSAARALQAAAARRSAVLHCHLKIDTGMNRLGFRHDNLRRTLPEVAGSAIWRSTRSIHTSRPPTSPRVRRLRFSASDSSRRSPFSSRWASARACGTRRTALRCSATSASGTTSSVRAC